MLILTNDDGIAAPGLMSLYQAAAGLGDLRVIAPASAWSGKSHAVTTSEAFRVERRPDGWVVVDGTPADCVRVGLHHLEPGAAWVLAGINAGGNLGADVYHSGTVAAAREAVLHGRPAIALSHYIARGRPIDWPRATDWAAHALSVLMARPWEPGSLWNVNLPHPAPGSPEPALVDCPLDPSPLPLDFSIEAGLYRYTGDYQRRARLPGADVSVCFGGQIAVTLIRLYPPEHAPAAYQPPETSPGSALA